MTNNPTFKEATKKEFQTLRQYVPVVARVHGTTHPEFHEVHRQFDSINEKIKKVRTKKPDLGEEFIKLREITNNYNVPSDVCETYEAVYHLLAEIDNIYHA